MSRCKRRLTITWCAGSRFFALFLAKGVFGLLIVDLRLAWSSCFSIEAASKLCLAKCEVNNFAFLARSSPLSKVTWDPSRLMSQWECWQYCYGLDLNRRELTDNTHFSPNLEASYLRSTTRGQNTWFRSWRSYFHRRRDRLNKESGVSANKRCSCIQAEIWWIEDLISN